MATRPTWQGYLRLSLVSCPVALYTATSRSADVSFNMLHKATHNRIRMIPTDPDTGPVERADIVKGYEIEKGRYVVVTDEEIKNVRLETTRTIDIDVFAERDSIDWIWMDTPYYLVPSDEVGEEAFAAHGAQWWCWHPVIRCGGRVGWGGWWIVGALCAQFLGIARGI